MPVLSHLRELRRRIFIVLFCYILACIILFEFMDPLMTLLLQLGKGYRFIYISPSELFMQYFKMSLVVGLVAVSPLIFYQIWAFLRSGLTKTENRLLIAVIIASSLFFLLGLAFAYVVVVPLMLNFFINFSENYRVTAMITISNYVSYILSTGIVFGIIFEIPVLITLLTQIGLINPLWLKKARRYIYIIILILSAVITPTTDILNMMIMSVPMIVLFELSVFISSWVYRRKARKKKRNQEN